MNPKKKMKTENVSTLTLVRRSIRLQNRSEELPYQSSTTLLDLNDDCLYAIFDLGRISIGDLCSVTQTCTRLKVIGTTIFTHKHNHSCDLRKIEQRTSVAVLTSVMQLFGSTILTLRISLRHCSHPQTVIDSINRYCKALKSLTLESYEVPDCQQAINGLGLLFEKLTHLHLNGVAIDGIETTRIITATGTLINFFIKCQLLRSLRVEKCKSLERIIFESCFPKLERFLYYSYIDINIEGFILRHNSLKEFTFLMVHSTNFSYNLEALTIGFKNLEKLTFALHNTTWPPNTQWLTQCLARLEHLREITLGRININTVAKLVEAIPATLETLTLKSCSVDAALIPAMSHVKNLRILRMYKCEGSLDISHVGQLTQLTELSMDNKSIGSLQLHPRSDIVKTVSDLISLRKLTINLKEFKITQNLYRQLYDAVEKRTDAANRSLEIICAAIDVMDSNVRTVKINKS